MRRVRLAKRCKGDRHHLRLIVAPEDDPEMANLRAFTRDLMAAPGGIRVSGSIGR